MLTLPNSFFDVFNGTHLLQIISNNFITWLKNKDYRRTPFFDLGDFGVEVSKEDENFVDIWSGEVPEQEGRIEVKELIKLLELWIREREEFEKDPQAYEAAIERGEKIFEI